MHRLAALFSAVALTLAGCAGADGGADGADGPDSGPVVVTTVYPIAWMAAEIAPGADHRFLSAEGQDPHDLELTPADRALLERADLVVYLGALGFQPQVEEAVAERAGATLSVADVLGEGGFRPLDHADDDHAEDDHAEEGLDPHAWFDPALMATVAEALGDAVAELEPERAEEHRAAAAGVRDELLALSEELDALFADCRLDTAIVSHEAYAYLLAPHGLTQEGISGASGHAEASPRRLAELTERIRSEGVPAVLAEPVEGRADAEALARESGVEILDVDSLEVAPEEGSGYVADLRAQAGTFAEALACG